MAGEDTALGDLMILVAVCERAMATFEKLDPGRPGMLGAIEALRDMAAAEIRELTGAQTGAKSAGGA